MLTHLSLKDFAVVSANELALSAGFTVVTGETGAGKSLMVDALLCLTGNRADASMVRHGAERAELTAEFDLSDAPEAQNWLEGNDFDEGQGCLLRRVIRADGGSKAWINGRSATLSQLDALGKYLVEIHGQHEQQSLLERRKQLHLLDEFGKAKESAEAVRLAHRQWLDFRNTLDTLLARGDVSERIAYLEHQLTEMQRHPLEPERIEMALTRHKRHSQSAQLIAACASAAQMLDGEDNASALGLLRAGMVQIGRWQDSDAGLSEVHAMLETADVQMKEALSQLRHLQEGIELDAGELNDLESQLSHWHDLTRKHRVSLEKLQEKSQDLEIELTALRQAGSQLEQLNASLAESQTRWQNAAGILRKERLQASELLSTMVSELLAELGMAGGRFAVALEDNDDAIPQAHGLERCEFMVSANPGQPLRPLRKVASGGELARISLAIEVATLGLDPIPTMVFDEVDAGIGGAVAETVGRKLRTLGNRCQVLAVTHLAQVASLGHQHLRVAKHSEGAITESQVTVLEAETRVQEIARMMGGQVLTPQTLAHAEVMLNHGQS